MFWIRRKTNIEMGTRAPLLINVSVCILLGAFSPHFTWPSLALYSLSFESLESSESFEGSLYQSLAPDNLPRDMRLSFPCSGKL